MRHESTGPRPRAPVQPWRRAALAVWALPALTLPLGNAKAAEIIVRVDGAVASPAPVLVSLCSGGLEPGDCGLAQSVPATGTVVVVRFSDVPPGVYAVAAFQDINGNGTLDRSPRGLPREPYGFSREAGRVSSPRFDRAAFVISGDATVAVHLAMPGRP